MQEFFGGKKGVYAGYTPTGDKTDPNHPNDPNWYANYVAKKMGVTPTQPLSAKSTSIEYAKHNNKKPESSGGGQVASSSIYQAPLAKGSKGDFKGGETDVRTGGMAPTQESKSSLMATSAISSSYQETLPKDDKCDFSDYKGQTDVRTGAMADNSSLIKGQPVPPISGTKLARASYQANEMKNEKSKFMGGAPVVASNVTNNNSSQTLNVPLTAQNTETSYQRLMNSQFVNT
jgi:hypothetical protein